MTALSPLQRMARRGAGRRWRRSAALLTAALLALEPAARAGHGHGGAPPAPRSIEAPEEGVWLPMEDYGGRPVVSVRIAEKGPFRFVFDTGANVAAIGSAFRAELSLPAAGGMTAVAAGGGPAPEIVVIPEIRLGEMTLRGVIAAVMPGSPLPPGKDMPQGVLSASALSGYLVTLDYPGRRVSIRRGTLPEPDGRAVFEYGEGDFPPTIPLRVAGRAMRAHLDTGSGYGITLPAGLLRELPLGSKPTSAGTASTHGGAFPIIQASIQGTIEVGAFPIDAPLVSFADVRSGADPTIANLGSAVLRNFVVTLDAKTRRVRFERP